MWLCSWPTPSAHHFAPRPTLPAHPQEGPEANVHTRWHGKSPTSIAGTVVYIIANLPGKTFVPLPDICRTCGVAEGTIRQIYRGALLGVWRLRAVLAGHLARAGPSLCLHLATGLRRAQAPPTVPGFWPPLPSRRDPPPPEGAGGQGGRVGHPRRHRRAARPSGGCQVAWSRPEQRPLTDPRTDLTQLIERD